MCYDNHERNLAVPFIHLGSDFCSMIKVAPLNRTECVGMQNPFSFFDHVLFLHTFSFLLFFLSASVYSLFIVTTFRYGKKLKPHPFATLQELQGLSQNSM